jgi:hypothetical protein
MKNFALTLNCLLALTALSACAPATKTPEAIAEAESVVAKSPAVQAPAAPIRASIQALYQIPAPGAAALDSFNFYYDQDRGDSFFAASIAANRIFVLGTEQGELFGEIKGTASTTLKAPKFIREADNQFFVLDTDNRLNVLAVDFIARSDGEIKIPELSAARAMAVSKQSGGYSVAVVDESAAGKQLKIFLAAISEYSAYRKNDLNIVQLELQTAQPLTSTETLVLSSNKEAPGFVLAQDNEARFMDVAGQIEADRVLQASANILALDAMVCRRGSDPGYFIVAQQNAEGQAQLEILGRKDLQQRGIVQIEGLSRVSDLSFVPRPTQSFAAGGVYLIADGKFVALDWQKIAEALRIRKVCF